MTLRAALLMGFQAAYLCMTFLVVNSMVPRILVVDLMHLVAETVVNLVKLVVYQLLLYFVVEIAFFPYAAIMM